MDSRHRSFRTGSHAAPHPAPPGAPVDLPAPVMEPRPRPLRFADCDILRLPVGPGALQLERYGHGGHDVVLLHGFGTSAFLWRRVAPSLAVAGMTAWAPDLFGHGASDRPVGAAYDIRAQAQYLAHALRHLELHGTTVVGSDIGAAVAVCLALDAPEAVAQLVLISPAPLRGTPGPDIRLMQRESARHLLRLVRGLFGAHPLLLALLQNAVSNPALLDTRLVGRYVAPYVGREGLNHFLALARSIEEDDLGDIDPGRVAQPTLLLHGDSDRWFSATEAHELAGRFPNATAEWITGSGRLIAEEQPDALTRRLVAFVRAVPGVRRKQEEQREHREHGEQTAPPGEVIA